MSTNDDTTLLEDDGAGYLISVSDLMAGLLFVFIITLMAFVLSFQRATEEQEKQAEQASKKRMAAEAQREILSDRSERAERELAKLRIREKEATQERDALNRRNDDLTNAQQLRSQMLAQIRLELEDRGIIVEIDDEHGILHLTEQAVQFQSGQATLPQEQVARLNVIGGVLAEILPCYVSYPTPPPSCIVRYRSKLEAVFIEGHTDNVPVGGGRFMDNWDLSAQRAMYVYRLMALRMHPALAALQNEASFPIFSVSGYGEGRPRNRHRVPTADPVNRRIDLRFIMTPPKPDLRPVREAEERGL